MQRMIVFLNDAGLLGISNEAYRLIATPLFMLAMVILAYGFWQMKHVFDEYAFIEKSTMKLVKRFEDKRSSTAKAMPGGKKQKQR